MTGINIHAQKTLIDVAVDSSAILIGEQTVLHLTVTTDPNQSIQMILPVDTLMRGVEVLAYSIPDSTIIDNRLLIKQDVLVTSFDSALYLLPPFKVIDGVDTILSNQVALKVATIPVNVENPEEFYDIKGVWKAPFVLADYYPIIYGVLFALFLLCVVAYMIQRVKNQKPIISLKKQEPKLPPHQQAVKELDEIKQQKLWQQGRNKEYYTQITDTLRRYIFERFGVYAMEMTSNEILDIIHKVNEVDSVYNNLKQIFEISDLVKFAKWLPLPDENNLSMMNAYLFVNQTKVEEIPVSEENKEIKENEVSEDTTNNIAQNKE